MSGQYKVAWLCEALLVSRSGYYDWIKCRRHPGLRQVENTRLRQRIREEFMRSRQTYGSPRLARVLAARDGAIASPGSCVWSGSSRGNAPNIASRPQIAVMVGPCKCRMF